MLRQHGLESEVYYLVPIQGEKCLILNIAANCQPETFASASRHCVDAVPDSHTKACSVAEEVDYLLLEVSHAHHNVRDSICFEPFDHPLYKRLSANLYDPFWQVGRYGSQPNTLAT